jgi:hypothetical protein
MSLPLSSFSLLLQVSILREVAELREEGFKEVVLLGQNVNSYHDQSAAASDKNSGDGHTKISDGDAPSNGATPPSNSDLHVDAKQMDTALPASPPATPASYENMYEVATGFTNLYSREKWGKGARFADLLEAVARANPEMRVRFTSPHPKDYSQDVIDVIGRYPNVCNGLHLPAQSGSTSVLDSMRRGYTREAYLDLVRRLREAVGGAENLGLTSDFISGFCGETEADHTDTLTLLEAVGFDNAFMFAYSVRPRTHAYHKLEDDVLEADKKRRLQEVIGTYRRVAAENNKGEIGRVHLVLVEGGGKARKAEKAEKVGSEVGEQTGAEMAVVGGGARKMGEVEEVGEEGVTIAGGDVAFAVPMQGLTDTNKRCSFPDVAIPWRSIVRGEPVVYAVDGVDGEDGGMSGGGGGASGSVYHAGSPPPPPSLSSLSSRMRRVVPGDYVAVRVTKAGVSNLHGEALYATTLQDFALYDDPGIDA